MIRIVQVSRLLGFLDWFINEKGNFFCCCYSLLLLGINCRRNPHPHIFEFRRGRDELELHLFLRFLVLFVRRFVAVFIHTGDKVGTPIVQLTFFLGCAFEHAVPSIFISLEHP